MKNLSSIRKLFGSTQEELAQLLGVSRVTISKLENDVNYHMTDIQKEKLSMYFYISPEYFEEKELDDIARKQIMTAGRQVAKRNNIENNSQSTIVNKLTEISTIDAMKQYMIATKVLLVKADQLTISQFEDIIEVNDKLGIRLNKMLQEKKAEKGKSIADILDTFMQKYE